MNRIATNIMPNTLQTAASSTSTERPGYVEFRPTAAIPENWVESLFEKMLYQYGAKFSDQWKNIDPAGLKRHWATKLGGLTRDELRAGVERLDGRDWPPTCSEFIKLCRPAIDALCAYHEAAAGIQARQQGEIGKWSHPAIFWAAMPMAFDLCHQTFAQIRPRWEREFAAQMARGQWPAIPAPMLALPAAQASGERLSREQAAALLRQLGAAGIARMAPGDEAATASTVNPASGRPVTATPNHKRWAERIKARQQRHDQTLLPQLVGYANQALGLP
jgi:hypothetical protein